MSGRERVLLSGVLAMGMLAGCQPRAETAQQAEARMNAESAAAKTVLDSLNAEFVTHFNLGHAEVVAGFYTEQAHMMPPNAPTAVGREAIQHVLELFIGMKPVLTLHADAVTASGDHALERGVVTFTLTPPGAKAAVSDTGKYLVHWQRVEGKWYLADDIWNSDLPAAPSAAPAPPKQRIQP
jgi:ketosteroid isomerase-like protein